MNTITTLTTSSQARWEAQVLRAGTSLKRHRLALGLSQADVATRAGVTRPDYADVETGRWPREWPQDTVVAMLVAAEHSLRLIGGGHAKPVAA
jgi:DNA-binding XRE family transcriptional regulator